MKNTKLNAAKFYANQNNLSDEFVKIHFPETVDILVKYAKEILKDKSNYK